MKRPPKARKLINDLIKEMDDFSLVLLRDRMVAMADEILDNQEQIRADMKHHIVSPELYIRIMETVKTHLKYD